MVTISEEFKEKVIKALFEAREHYELNDHNFASKFGINASVYSRLKSGERSNLLKPTQYLHIGRLLGVTTNDHKWNMVETDVFKLVQEDILFCQEYSKARICVDECGIGKTFTAKYLSRTLTNCFYIDASQCKGKYEFITVLAKSLGVESNVVYNEKIKNIIYYLNYLTKPIIIIDEAGDFESNVYLVLKELWNATENFCGWYLMGADGLKHNIDRGIKSHKVGFKELYSRYSDKYSKVVPVNRNDKQEFYEKLIRTVVEANISDKSRVNEIVKKCLVEDTNGNIGGLRRAQAALILYGLNKEA